MPTYEYKCFACDHAFERFQSITAEPIKKCPQCGKNKVRRMIGTGAGLIFKGSGFYITDYRDKSYTEKAKTESGGSSSSPGSSNGTSGTSESKPSSTGSTAAPSTPATPPPSSKSSGGGSKPSKK